MTHQSKRPYTGSQPSITSYFPATVASSHGHSNLPHSSTPSANESCFPVLPSHVQSNLINVGMRVRKSVPEGYKTTSCSQLPLFAEIPPAPAQVPAQKAASKTRPRAGVRELTPFCGILKVGGMVNQAWGIYNPSGHNHAHDGSIYADADMDEDEDEDPSFSSQDSMASNGSAITPSRENKRRFFEDSEEDAEDIRTSFVNVGSRERVMAVPRRKGWGGKIVGRAGQENVTVVGEDVDFQDAEFLDYGLDGEVEMSG